MAVECRKVCGLTRLVVRDGVVAAAFFTVRATSAWMP
jgi:hypothetical protein